VTIDILPDDALLYVFDFYLAGASEVEAWHVLVHVCRRWRIIVFGSPRRLNLQIECILFGDKLDIWPTLPIVISSSIYPGNCYRKVEAILEHHDRVCRIELDFPAEFYAEWLELEEDDEPFEAWQMAWDVEEIFAALEKPFPVLTALEMSSNHGESRYLMEFPPVYPNPDKFLGGSTHLRSLSLTGIPIPELPKCLLSSTNLVDLRLKSIPHHGYFSPDAMVTALSALTRLKILHFEPNYYARSESPNDLYPSSPLLTRTVLPSLTVFDLRGNNENLEEFVARIDAPLLDFFHVAFVVPDFDPNCPQVVQFISRIPNFRAPDKAHIVVDTKGRNLWINFSWSNQISSVGLKIYTRDFRPERKISYLVQLCREPFPPLPTLEYLYICGGYLSLRPQLVATQWLELLQLFTAVKNLYLTKELAPVIAHVLQGLTGERAMVLPTLENVFIESQPSGSVHEAIGQFVAARQLSGHPIDIHDWDGTGSITVV